MPPVEVAFFVEIIGASGQERAFVKHVKIALRKMQQGSTLWAYTYCYSAYPFTQPIKILVQKYGAVISYTAEWNSKPAVRQIYRQCLHKNT
jgi:hypothetical protein